MLRSRDAFSPFWGTISEDVSHCIVPAPAGSSVPFIPRVVIDMFAPDPENTNEVCETFANKEFKDVDREAGFDDVEGGK